MPTYLGVPILALAALLQASLLAVLFPSGGGPHLVMLCVLAWGLNQDDLRAGLTWALIGGVCLDLFSAAPLGTSAVGLVLLAFFISGLGSQFYGLRIPLLAGLTAVGTLLQQLSTLALVLALARLGWLGLPEQPDGLPFFTSLTSAIPSALLYNLILIWPIHAFIGRIALGGRGGNRG
jgi:rod shape-determining protein MreD